MKRIIIIIVAVILVGVSVFTIYNANSNPVRTGYFLKATNGYCLFIENESVYIIFNTSYDIHLFEGLRNGDKIKITIGDAITFPEQIPVAKCKLIQEGSLDNITREILAEIEAIGLQIDSE